MQNLQSTETNAAQPTEQIASIVDAVAKLRAMLQPVLVVEHVDALESAIGHVLGYCISRPVTVSKLGGDRFIEISLTFSRVEPAYGNNFCE